MKYNDLRIQNEVLRALHKHYSFTISSTEFIPVGEESLAYKMITTTGERFFVKYCNRKHFIEDISKVNHLLLQLQYLDFVVPPIASSGRTEFEVKNGKVSIYPYIDGSVVDRSNDKFDKELVEKLTTVMAAIHNTTPSISPPLPKENFTNSFTQRLEQILKDTKSGKFEEEVRNLLEQNLRIIEKIINTHNAIADKYRKEKPTFVLTHGDITGLNIIISHFGLKLTDWDDAMFAPAERDINFFVDNPHFSLEKYKTLTGLKEYQPVLREYYGQKWALDSIIGNFESIVKDEKSKSDKSEYIEEIKQYLNFYK